MRKALRQKMNLVNFCEKIVALANLGNNHWILIAANINKKMCAILRFDRGGA